MTLRRMFYAGGELITSDAVAHAVLEYAAKLGNRGEAATLLVPAVGLVDGETAVELLVGPASQLAAAPVESDESPPDDAEFLRDMRTRMSMETKARAWSGDAWSGDDWVDEL
ncbi:MAG: hypothetical protein M3N46_04540 [Actinomycetota bacterium]|nr:hypothetical protein [Actinomycetota bacterium]